MQKTAESVDELAVAVYLSGAAEPILHDSVSVLLNSVAICLQSFVHKLKVMLQSSHTPLAKYPHPTSVMPVRASSNQSYPTPGEPDSST